MVAACLRCLGLSVPGSENESSEPESSSNACRRPSGRQELYDLALDPLETNELIAAGPLTPSEQAALTSLVALLTALLSSP